MERTYRIGRRRTLLLGAALILTLSACVGGGEDQDNALERLQKAGGGAGAEIVIDPVLGVPSFASLELSTDVAVTNSETATQAALAVLGEHGEAFGIDDVGRDLKVEGVRRDDLGMHHVELVQTRGGVPVYGGDVAVHFSPDGRRVVAVGSHFVPGITLEDITPGVPPDQATEAARKQLPEGKPSGTPELFVYAGTGSAISGDSARLAWMVEVADPAVPARSLYVVDAEKGVVIDEIPRLFEELARDIYTSNNTPVEPPDADPVRKEGEPPSGDEDADNAYDFSGAAYDYFLETHSWVSWDNRSAPLVSSVHYGTEPNAYWNGNYSVYADGYAVLDVVGHELTHGVTRASAELEYLWQSGALNESFSDIFGAMIDRDDWTLGEDTPGGVIRSLSDPAKHDQPDHVSKWYAGCYDNQGVHINSGIFNLSFYKVATALTPGVAERIYFRTLTQYLQRNSTFNDAYAAVIRSAVDLHGAKSRETEAVVSGLAAVGLDGNWEPPEPEECPTRIRPVEESPE